MGPLPYFPLRGQAQSQRSGFIKLSASGISPAFASRLDASVRIQQGDFSLLEDLVEGDTHWATYTAEHKVNLPPSPSSEKSASSRLGRMLCRIPRNA